MDDISAVKALGFLEVPGELAERIRMLDWGRTPLGVPEAWDEPLKTLVGLMLSASQPTFMFWGEQRIWLYNDAFLPILGTTHPAALGQPVLNVRREAREELEPLFSKVLSGEPMHMGDFAIMLDRRGRRENVFFNYSYTPVRDATGAIVGLFGFCTEATDQVRDVTTQTELRRLNEILASSERILRERESELAQVQRIAKVGGVVVDVRDGFHNRRSPEYLSIHGLPASAANETHEDWVRRVHPEDRARTERQFLDALSGTSGKYSSEYRIVRPDTGETRWLAVEALIERDPDGKARRLIGAHMDITDRTLAKELLRESEERFRLIADSAPVPMWVTRLDRTRAFANQAYVDFLGVRYEEALAFDWRTILHPADVGRIVQESTSGEASRKPFTLEARYRRADGVWRWLRSESQPRWGATGELVGFIGVAHDITAAKVAEIELRTLNETLERRIDERTSQLRSILETTNQYQCLLDAHGSLLYANATALAGIYAKPADVLGRPFCDAPWFTDTQGARGLALSALSAALTGESARTEMRLQLPVGERYFDFAMRAIKDKRGGVDSVLVEAVDITERRQNEEALRQAQKMEAVGQLTGGVAHDFNNLLTIIRSATDFLRRRDLPEERRRRYVDAISETADRATKLTSQLLAFARRQPLTPQVFNVGAKVAITLQLIRPLVGDRIRIEFDQGISDCFANADLVQFETSLVNLAVNARDAMEGEGLLSITVSTADAIPPVRGNSARHGDFVAISVTDTGSGILPDHLDSIFEPFFTTKEVGRGTGLGLSQTFGFAKQSGGEITVKSDVGTGTTFTLYLPKAGTPADAERPSSAPAELGPTGREHRILLVEDNEEVGSFAAELLTDLGYNVERTYSAKEALDVLAKDDLAFDLVFSDVIMPGMNGIELAATVRQRYPGLPVVLTSGYSDVLAKNADRGFDLIQKPYSLETISRALRKAIVEFKRIS